MKINEIFYSIQGEGKWTGLPNIFIRTTGCNLRCTYCDTQYAYNAGDEMNIIEILAKIKSYPCQYICITGGEPLIQMDTIILIKKLLEKKYKICLETNGSQDIKKIVGKTSLMISLDVKCPSSQMHQQMNLENIEYLTSQDQMKFVIKDKRDYQYAKKIVKNFSPKSMIFFQSVWGTNLKDLSSWILKDGLDVRVGYQLQKLIWGDQIGV